MSIIYSNVFQQQVNKIEKYLKENNLKSMILGISGGIDSTVVAALCHEVSKKTGIPLIGRSLPIKNKSDEFDTSVLVGKAFCDDFKVVNLKEQYDSMLNGININEKIEQTSIANGNIQARLRMIYLYNLAGIHKGIVMDTDNLTEHYLGFYTIHGDQGDLNPIGKLWKMQVYELANYIRNSYVEKIRKENLGSGNIITYSDKPKLTEQDYEWYESAICALNESIHLTPTDGLGISNSDLEQIGAKTYEDVDDILKMLIDNNGNVNTNEFIKKCNKYGTSVVEQVTKRFFNTSYKREKLPIVI